MPYLGPRDLVWKVKRGMAELSPLRHLNRGNFICVVKNMDEDEIRDDKTQDGFEDWSSSHIPDNDENETRVGFPNIIGTSYDADADRARAEADIAVDVEVSLGEVALIAIETTLNSDGSHFCGGQQVAVTNDFIVPCDDGGYITTMFRTFLKVMSTIGITKDASRAMLEENCEGLISWVKNNAQLESHVSDNAETMVSYILVWPAVDDDGEVSCESLNWDDEIIDVIRDWHAPGSGFL